jgi:hypothetical protein
MPYWGTALARYYAIIIIHYYYYTVVQDANFTTALELAVRFGKTLIIQEMDGVEPILFPLLRGDLTAMGRPTSRTIKRVKMIK